MYQVLVLLREASMLFGMLTDTTVSHLSLLECEGMEFP